MANSIRSIPLDRLVPHPDNPNRMTKANFAKLLRNIDRTGRYEPLVVRPCPQKPGFFQIINGHHRFRALGKLGCDAADSVIWEIEDHEADILLATLNRLGGSDEITRKLRLLNRLNKRLNARQLAGLLPLNARQIERLANFRLPRSPTKPDPIHLLSPLVFFVTDDQHDRIEKALSLAAKGLSTSNKAVRKAAALAEIAERFLCASLKSEGQRGRDSPQNPIPDNGRDSFCGGLEDDNTIDDSGR